MIYTHVDEDPFYNYKVYSLNNNMVELELSSSNSDSIIRRNNCEI